MRMEFQRGVFEFSNGEWICVAGHIPESVYSRCENMIVNRQLSHQLTKEAISRGANKDIFFVPLKEAKPARVSSGTSKKKSKGIRLDSLEV